MIAVVSWGGPVQISWQVARQSAAIIAVRTASPFDDFANHVALWRMTGRLLVCFWLNQAEAAPIADPTAPIGFKPTITQTTAGVPTVNVTTPNSSWLSYNSLTGGGTFLGGTASPLTPPRSVR